MVHVVLVLRRTGRQRAVGPFDTEADAGRWLDSHPDPGADHLIQPLEDPGANQYGRHALIPSPPVDRWAIPTPRTAHFRGLLALFNVASSDGRVLVMQPEYQAGHFATLPIPLMLADPRGQMLIIGVVEKVYVEPHRLHGEGRLSLTALRANAPDLARNVLTLTAPQEGLPLIPCSVGIGHGEFSEHDGRSFITGDWFLREVAIGTEPSWPGAGLRVTETETPR